MVCCPFHDDRHPSMKLNEDYFYCFGCGATGDVVDFTARLLDLSAYEAAQRLAADFGLDTSRPSVVAKIRKPRPRVSQLRQDELLCINVRSGYLHFLEDWKDRYAPQMPEGELEETKSQLEISILQEEMHKRMPTREQIAFFIYRFRKFDVTKREQRQRLIDSFVR